MPDIETDIRIAGLAASLAQASFLPKQATLSSLSECEDLQFRLGDSFTILPRVDSTMTVVEENLRRHYARQKDGATVIALEQTAGQGSSGKKWHSGKGNAMFSRVVDIEAHEYGQEIALIAAASVAEIVQKLLPHKDVSVKWPNDVLVDGAKICGVLVYPSYDFPDKRGTARKINLGVGVNLCVAPPMPDGRETTSLQQQGVRLELDKFMPRFEKRFTVLRQLYAQTRDFNVILARIGFLDADGMLRLTERATEREIRGVYEGFPGERNGGYPIHLIRVRRADDSLTARDLHRCSLAPLFPRPAMGPGQFQGWAYAPAG